MAVCEKLLNCRTPRPDALIRLFCFPWAGGGSNFFAAWTQHFPNTVEVNALVLPGRETRMRDPGYKTHTELVSEIVNTILPVCKDKPFAFYGHSFGSLISFEVARTLKEEHNIEPVHLFVSGCSAPHSEKRKACVVKTSQLSEDDFMCLLQRFGGTPKEVLENKGLAQIFIPPLRSDFEVAEGYDYELPDVGKPLACHISVMDGKDDIPHDLDAWKELTSGEFDKTMYPGGHFFLMDQDNKSRLIKQIDSCLHIHDTSEIV